MMQPAAVDLEQGLTRIRARRRRVWVVWFGSFLVVGLFGSLTESPQLTLYLALASMGLFVAAMVAVAFSRCPRCGKLFHQGMVLRNSWTNRCLHCGLPLWSSTDES